jgi:hypothetical protein
LTLRMKTGSPWTDAHRDRTTFKIDLFNLACPRGPPVRRAFPSLRRTKTFPRTPNDGSRR